MPEQILDQPEQRRDTETTMNDIRIGTIGSGSIVSKILNGVSLTAGIRCEAIYSRASDKGRALADAFGVEKVYTDVEALLTDPAIDYIYIASPNSLHFDQARAALEHGKNVLCEKPFTSTVREADELIRLARERRLFLYEMVPTPFLPNYRLVKEHLAEIGRARLIQCNYSQYSSRYDNLKAGEVTNIFDPAYSGGCLQDINYYNVYFTVSFFGTPLAARYDANRFANGIDTSGVVTLQYADCVATLSGAKDTWGVNFAQIEGEDGYLYIENGANALESVRVVTRTSDRTYNEQPESDRWVYEIQGLVPVLQAADHADCMQRLELTRSVVDIVETVRKQAGIVFPADR